VAVRRRRRRVRGRLPAAGSAARPHLRGGGRPGLRGPLRIELDDRWHTREARVSPDTVDGPRSTVLRSDGECHWTVDGRPRLDQTYARRDGHRFDYTSEGGDFQAVLDYDDAGLIVDYPGIAVRFA
jgi:hypothetical protein